MDKTLKAELGPLYVGVPGFHQVHFGGVPGLEAASEAVFRECTEGNNPLFKGGWTGWSENAKLEDVRRWFVHLYDKLKALAEAHRSVPICARRPLGRPRKQIHGSTAEPELDVGFIGDTDAGKWFRYYWSQILIPGVLKSDRVADGTSKTWLHLGRSAREMLATNDTRRFVLGFTLCGPLMRIWPFYRLGGVASEPFDINEDGLQFVYTVLEFLWTNEEQLGLDPTITTDSQRFITIQRNGRAERLVIDGVIKRSPSITGRATTCWKAHLEENPQIKLVVKDSWQSAERDEEGEFLKAVTDRGVINVARYYHHETVFVHGVVDDIQGNVRGGLNFTEATNYPPRRVEVASNLGAEGAPQQDHSTTGGERSSNQADALLPPNKRPASQTGSILPPSKRSRAVSPTTASNNPLPNRVHRRIVLRDYGRPIYKASSRSALLTALEGCIEGHQSLYNARFLHRDISVNNLMINEDKDNTSWPSFLINLDLVIEER